MKKILLAVAVVILVMIVFSFVLSDETEYKMCLGAQEVSNKMAKALGEKPTNFCNE
ncbi:hypothetical protein [Peribacillus sp. YIM B13477]|uniref:hypothetical protein n=1 Tax=Peribacillus sp. YIM B13477 TaxID=3366300 RepID=UPI00366FBE31